MQQEDEICAGFRDQWRTHPIYEGKLEILGYTDGAASTPQRVRLIPSGCIAYIKRVQTVTGVPEGAHEYIAAELAYLIGVPVPPVGFYSDDTGKHFSLSVRAFPEAIHWGDVPLSEEEREYLRPVFSASAVLHAWIADNDHEGHPGNLMLDANSPEGQPRVAFIDHAMSLTATWNPNDPAASLPDIYYIDSDKFLSESILTTLQRVSGVSERVRESTISRIPQGYLSTVQRATVLKCLRCRGNQLLAAFADMPGEK